MKRNRLLLLIICYGFIATLAVCYGLLARQSLFVTFVAFHLAVCLGIPLFHGLWEGRLKQNWQGALRFSPPEGILFGCVSGFVLLAGIMAGLWLLLHGTLDPVLIRQTLIYWGLTADWIWLFAFYIIVINSFLEELLWRGFVIQRLLSGMSRWKAILLSGFFYSLYHLVLTVILFGWKWAVIITLLVFAVSLFWGWLKFRFPSLYATWISHLLADLGIIASLFAWIY